MKGKGEEDDAPHGGEGLLRGGEGCHSATHRLASREKGKPVRERRGRRPDGLQQNGLIIGAPTSMLHVGELVSKCGDPPIGQTNGQIFHEAMPHPGAGAVPQNEQTIGVERTHE